MILKFSSQLFFSIVAIILLSACSSGVKKDLVVDTRSGLFSGESLLRGLQVQSKPGEVSLKDCYEGKYAAYLDDSQKKFIKSAKDFDYWMNLGNCLSWNQKWREARFFHGLALELAKTPKQQALTKNNIAVFYLNIGRIGAAFDLLSEAMELAPELVTPKFNLIQIYLSQNMPQEAMMLLNKPPFTGSNDFEVLHLKGLAHLEAQQIQLARNYLSAIDPRYHSRADIGLTLAQWHFMEGRPLQALSALDKIKKLDFPIHKKLAERLQFESKQLQASLELAQKNKLKAVSKSSPKSEATSSKDRSPASKGGAQKGSPP
jgi:tetratricopeptide (TPR) repeat protein